MTQTAHVPAREPESHILREAAGAEPQPETLPSRAERLFVAIVGNPIPCPRTKESRGGRKSPWVPPSPYAPGTPQRAIRSPIPPTGAWPFPPTCRARYARALGVYGCVRIWEGPRRAWKGFTV